MLNLSATLTAIKNQLQNKPVEIHDIYLGDQETEDSDTLHFVGFYKTINFFSYFAHTAQAYIPLAITRSAIKKSSKDEIEHLSYKVDNVNKAMGAYAAAHDFRNKRIVTRMIWRDHLTSYLDAKIMFDGFIQSISFEQKTMAADCVPKIGSLNYETGWPYQIQCNAKFGDAYCTINKNDPINKISGTATDGTKTTLTDVNNLSQVEDYWNFGTIIFTSGNNIGVQRKIINFELTRKITFDYSLDCSVNAGDTYIIYRGCDKTLNMCDTKYSNTRNYHGFHSIPLRA